VQVTWKEDVRVWHPGQDWIFEAGGLGIFDPTINALSILTSILPSPFALRNAKLAFPQNRQAPIAGELAFTDAGGAPIEASVDFLQTGPQTWDIAIETTTGALTLSKGGSELYLNGVRQEIARSEDVIRGEYYGVYAHFASLIRAGRCDVDVAPLRHVADAFMLGERIAAPPFSF
jgi:D-galactose 1-dehydrogenase